MLYYIYNNDVGENKDVSHVAWGVGSFNEISYDGENWEALSNNTLWADTSQRFLAPFSIRKVNAATGTSHWFGFSVPSYGKIHPIANEAGHTYLAVCDVRCSGDSLSIARFAVYNPIYSNHDFSGVGGQTTYSKVYGLFGSETGRFFIDASVSQANSTIQLDIKNWRQFDVTGWTQDQITALATKENYDEVYLTLPDTFHGVSDMTEDKFLKMGGIIRNDNVDGYMYVHDIGFNYSDIP